MKCNELNIKLCSYCINPKTMSKFGITSCLVELLIRKLEFTLTVENDSAVIKEILVRYLRMGGETYIAAAVNILNPSRNEWLNKAMVLL